MLENAKLLSYLMYFRLKGGGPEQYRQQWDSFWGAEGSRDGDGRVLWDDCPEHAVAADLDRFETWFAAGLPLVDLGCGSGRQTRFLAEHFPRVLGVDVAPSAIELAIRESEGCPNVAYRVLDALQPGEARVMHAELGDANVYTRGVLHVIPDRSRPLFVESLRTLLGRTGTAYLVELAVDALDHLRRVPGDSPSGLPRLVHEVVRHGVRPIGVAPEEHLRLFHPDRWEILDHGSTLIHTVPLTDGTEAHLPASYLVVRPRQVAH